MRQADHEKDSSFPLAGSSGTEALFGSPYGHRNHFWADMNYQRILNSLHKHLPEEAEMRRSRPSEPAYKTHLGGKNATNWSSLTLSCHLSVAAEQPFSLAPAAEISFSDIVLICPAAVSIAKGQRKLAIRHCQGVVLWPLESLTSTSLLSRLNYSNPVPHTFSCRVVSSLLHKQW